MTLASDEAGDEVRGSVVGAGDDSEGPVPSERLRISSSLVGCELDLKFQFQ